MKELLSLKVGGRAGAAQERVRRGPAAVLAALLASAAVLLFVVGTSRSGAAQEAGDVVAPGSPRDFRVASVKHFERWYKGVCDWSFSKECGSVGLAWSNPPDADLAGVRVLRSKSGHASSPDDAEGQRVVYEGSGTSFTDRSLTRYGTYYYTAFARDASGNWSEPATASATVKIRASFAGLGHPRSVKYGTGAKLTFLLGYFTFNIYKIIPDKTITVWRSSDGGESWKREGVAEYRSPSWGYVFTTKPIFEDTLFEARFAGDSVYTSAGSRRVKVRAQSQLSTPVVPKGIERNTPFTVYGYLKPEPIGKTRLYFYRYAKVRHEWVFYKSVAAKNTKYRTYARYSARVKLPYATDWYVKAFHKDSKYAPAWSGKRYFRVR